MPNLGGTLIEIAIGLTLVYLVLSLVVSGAQEWVSQIFRLRSKNLRKGIANLIGEAKTSDFYNHGVIKGLYDHRRKTWILGERLYPSYIPGDRFADALLGLFVFREGAGDDGAPRGAAFDGAKPLTAYIDETIDDPVLRDALKSLARRGDEKIDAFRDEIADWYDDAMQRVSGWYARRIRWIGLVVAILVVVTMNADTLRIAHTIWQSEVLRTSLATIGQTVATEGMPTEADKTTGEILDLLPLGWPCETGDTEGQPSPGASVCVLSNPAFDTPMGFVLKLLGWTITIFAVSLGAPFWFDLLKRVAKLRSVGDNPAERKPDRGAAG